MIESNTLNEETTLQSEGKADSSQERIMMEQQKEFDNKVKTFRNIVQQIEQDIQVLENMQDQYDLKITQRGQVEAETKQIQEEETVMREMYTGLNVKREVVIKDIANVLTLAEQIEHTLISDELPEWKRRQQMACIGGPPNACLDQLQNWFTIVAECLQQIRQQLKKVQELVQKFTYENDPLTLGKSQLDEQALSLFKNLLLNSFVVERQPCMPTHPQRPLVIKARVQFTVKIRLLVKLQELTCQPRVKAYVDKGLTERDTVKGFRNYILLTNVNKVMTIEEPSGCLSTEFRHMVLKERETTNTTEIGQHFTCSLSVYEHLHFITFNTQLVLPELCIDLSITSLPVVIINPYYKVSAAWGSILWYNMLCSEAQNLTFFMNPPPVKWGQLLEVINWQLSAFTTRVLNSEQLRVLADKLLGCEAQGDPEGLIHWNTFWKMLNEEHGCSIWEWIYENLHLIKAFLLDIWNDGYIMGFMSMEEEKCLLRDKPPGTFLLRFSETCRDGGITITWVEHSQDGTPIVRSTETYTKYNLQRISLPNVIRDYTVTTEGKVPVNPLIYLYPDIPRDVAFGRYYTNPTEGVQELQ